MIATRRLLRLHYVEGETSCLGTSSASVFVRAGNKEKEKGMLHRTKYNRFRNESVTSVDELIHDLSMNPKVSAAPTSSAEPPFSPQAEVLSPTTTASEPEDGGTTLCTFINKVSNLKFTNSGSLLGIKGLPSAVKDLAVSKFQGGGGSSSGNSGHSVSAAASGGSFLSSSAFSGPQFHQEPGNMSSNGKKGRLEELQQGGEDWNPGGNGRGNGLVNKPSRGWLHSSEKISGPGVTYIVKVGLFSVYFFFLFLPISLFSPQWQSQAAWKRKHCSSVHIASCPCVGVDMQGLYVESRNQKIDIE